MATPPAPPQLRLLLFLIAQGGEAHPDQFSPATGRVCRDRGWVERDQGQPWSIAPLRITADGRRAVLFADPDGYAAAVPDGQIDSELSRALDAAVPPAAAPRDARDVADALAGDRLIIYTSPCLGDLSPIRASGVSLRLTRADLTNSPAVPASIRATGRTGCGTVADDDTESLIFADESEYIDD